MSKQEFTPHWSEEPPDGYPFVLTSLNLEPALVPSIAHPDELTAIDRRGTEQLESGNYRDALWKFENYLLLVRENTYTRPAEKIVRSAGNCALALLKLAEVTKNLSQRKRALEHCKSFCCVCFRHQSYAYVGVSKMAKPFSWMGEALESEGNVAAAVHYYTRSYQAQQSLQVLFQIILLNGSTKNLLEEFNFEQSLAELLQTLIESKDFSSKHLKGFIESAKCLKRFKAAAKKISPQISISLFNLCSGKGQQLFELFELFSFSESQIAENEKQLFHCLLETKELFVHSQSLMIKLSKKFRTQYLAANLKCMSPEQVILLIDYGEIDPTRIDLSVASDKLFHDIQLVQTLLKCKGNPFGLRKKLSSQSESPLKYFASKYLHKSNRKLKSKMIQIMKLLIDAGAEVEDLNCYHRGSITTPLHVATELAIATGELEFLKSVHENWQAKSSQTDKDDKTPLHIAAQNYHETRRSIFIEVWCFLEVQCQIDRFAEDNKGKPAFISLPKDILGHLNTKVKEQNNIQASDDKDILSDLQELDSEETPQDIAPTLIEANSLESGPLEAESQKDLEQQYTEEYVLEKVKKLGKKPGKYFLNSRIESSTDKVNFMQSENPLLMKQISRQHSQTQDSRQPTCDPKCKSLPFRPDSPCTKWEVEILDSVQKQLEMMSPLLKKSVFKTIRKLARGYFSCSDDKKIKEAKSSVVFETRINKADRLLYTLLDRFSETDTEKARNLIRKEVYVYRKKIIVLDVVLRHKKISHHAERVLAIINEQTSEDELQNFLGKGHPHSVKLPQLSLYCKTELTQEESGKIKECLNAQGQTDENRKDSEVDVGTKTYSLSRLTVLGLLSREHERHEYPLKVTDDEFDIISKPENAPVVVLGRSGTGKTTTCLCRLWRKFIDYWDSDDRIDNPRIPKAHHFKWLKNEIDDDQTRACEDSPLHKDSDATANEVLCPLDTLQQCCEDKSLKTNSPHPAEKNRLPKIGNPHSALPNLPPETSGQQSAKKKYSLEVSSGPLKNQSPETDESHIAQEDQPQMAYDPLSADDEEVDEEAETTQESAYEHLHQVFITKSSKLCNQMRRKFCDYIADYEPTKSHLVGETDIIPSTFSEINDLCFPLFLTARQFFLMLDKSLSTEENKEEEFFHENDVIISSEHSDSAHGLLQESENDGKIRVEVTASYFQTHIWKNIYKRKSKLDPLLIWTEIQSFIKGSMEALSSKRGVLPKERYKELGEKKAPNFPMCRSEVYNFFEAYNNLKHTDNVDRFDNGDFIYHLHKRLQKRGDSNRWSIDCIYIDEVQDFTQAELTVIVQCCKDPNGFFFAGDTAQTIIKGIAFRFEDLASIFHLLKEKLGPDSKAVRIIVPKKPNLLTVNHRSHQGITSLATTVTDLLKKFFPRSFDWQGIPRDQSRISGPIPLFICSKNLMEYFLNLQDKPNTGLSAVEFGADQAVIVRDEKVLKAVPNSFRKGIVLTVQQCKGLEFNDVLLYNFFTDYAKSAATEQLLKVWRTSAYYLEENPDEAKNVPYRTQIHPLKFKEEQHKTLCSELKYLYTVITRAKSHLWIYESSLPETLPMLDYWHRRGVIKVVTDSSSQYIPQQFSSFKSTKNDWKRRGDEMREHQLWEVAMKCYQNAGEPLLEKQAHINLLLEEAAELKDSGKQIEGYTTKQRVAAALCLDCDELEHDVKFLLAAAQYMSEAEMHKPSAVLYEKLQKYQLAFKIYDTRLKDVESGARMKERLGEYREAIFYCYEKRRPDLSLKLARRLESEKKIEKAQISDIAYLQIEKYLRTKNAKEVIQWLDFIPNKEQQLHIKKQADLHKEVFDELCSEGSEESFTAALRLASAQCLFSKAIEIAKERNKMGTVTMLQLKQATKEIFSTRAIQTAGLSEDLFKLSKARNKSVACKAKLLLVMNGAQSDKTAALKLCKEALSMQTNKVEKLECFYQLRCLQEKKDKQLQSSIKETVHMIQEAERLISSPNSILTLQVEPFYGLENLGEIYCIPKEQDLWIRTLAKCTCDGEPCDSDGMLQLDKAKVCIAIIKHFQQYVDIWKEEIKHASKTLKDVFKLRFPFHEEMQEQHYLNPRRMMSAPDQIRDYISTCELAATIYKLNMKSFEDGDPTDTLVQLLSPFSQILIRFPKEAYEMISKSKALSQSIIHKVHNLLKQPENISSNKWLELWQISTILGSQKVVVKTLREQRNRLSETLKKESRDYRLDRESKSYEHYFSYWLKSCELLQSGSKCFVAVKLSTNFFIKLLALRTRPAISTENLVAILSVHTTAILGMLSYARYQQKQYQSIIPLPETFQRFVHSFHMVVCQGSGGSGILHSSLETAASIKDPNETIKKAQSLLLIFLKLLLGRCKSNSFNPLQQAMKELPLRSGCALHCLILTLTVYGNLTLMSNTSSESNFLPEVHEEIVQYLEETLSYTDNFALPFHNAFKSLRASKTAQDVFGHVISKLLIDTFEMSVMQIKTTKHGQKECIEFRPCLCEKILSIPLPLSTPKIDAQMVQAAAQTDVPTASLIKVKRDLPSYSDGNPPRDSLSHFYLNAPEQKEAAGNHQPHALQTDKRTTDDHQLHSSEQAEASGDNCSNLLQTETRDEAQSNSFQHSRLSNNNWSSLFKQTEPSHGHKPNPQEIKLQSKSSNNVPQLSRAETIDGCPSNPPEQTSGSQLKILHQTPPINNHQSNTVQQTGSSRSCPLNAPQPTALTNDHHSNTLEQTGSSSGPQLNVSQQIGPSSGYQVNAFQDTTSTDYIQSSDHEETVFPSGLPEANISQQTTPNDDHQSNFLQQTEGSDYYKPSSSQQTGAADNTQFETQLSNEDDEEVIIDDDDDDDLIQERKAIAQENREDNTVEEYTAASGNALVNPGLCLFCNFLFDNEMQFKYHYESDHHRAQAYFFGEYQKVKNECGFDHLIRDLSSTMIQCQQQGLLNIDISIAYVAAESLLRHCGSIEYGTRQMCNWQEGIQAVEHLHPKLISANVKLQLEMIKQRTHLATVHASTVTQR